MRQLKFALVLFLLVEVTKINGASTSSKLEPWQLLSANTSGYSQTQPPPGVTFEPIFEERVIPPQQINGRLLSVEEGCGYSSVGIPRVVGGGPARNGAYPWMTLLGYCPHDLRGSGYGTRFSCGGSLITSKHVLTAAHCLMPDLWFARLGEHDTRTTSDGKHQDIEIFDPQRHREYDNYTLLNDMAILRLKQDVEFNKRIRPICLPIAHANEIENVKHMQRFNFETFSTPFVAGWGTTTAGSALVSPYLKHVQVPFVNLKQCRQLLSMYVSKEQQISDMVVCAGVQDTQTSCQGDSGGPIMAPVPVGNGKFPFYQIGVVSWGPCGQKNTPTVYMKVQYFAEWIQWMLR